MTRFKNLGELFQHIVSKHPQRPYLGNRPRLADGKYGNYQWMTYAEADRAARRIAGWFESQGVVAGDPVAIIGPNRPEWLIAFWGAQYCGAVTVAIMNSAPDDAIETMLKMAGPKVVVSDGAARARKFAKDGGRALSFEDGASGVIGFQAALECAPRSELAERSGDDRVLVLFTSGSSGQPKSVPISQLMAVNEVVSGSRAFGDNDSLFETYLSFLPLGHVAGIMTELVVVNASGAAAYWHGDVKGLADDLLAAQPTLFAAVPRVYQNILNTIDDKLRHERGLKRRIAEWAIQDQVKRWRNKQPPGFLSDRIIGKKMRALFGGRLRAAISGSAPLPGRVLEFFAATLQVPVLESYGLTETTGPVIATPFNRFGMSSNIGWPMLDVEVKLEPVPDMGYTGHEGEIFLRGPTIFKGYDNSPEETNEALTPDGWLRTGDIGRRNPDGSYSIIDRRKNLLKLANGEYVAPERIESALAQSRFVRQVFVTAPREAHRLVAIVVPGVRAIEELGGELGINGGVKNVSGHPKVIARVLEDLREKSGGLRSYEIVHGIHLELPQDGLEDAFTIDNGLLTPSLKLRRSALQKQYSAIIDTLSIGAR